MRYCGQDSKHRTELTRLYNFQAVGFSVADDEMDEGFTYEAHPIAFPTQFSDELVWCQTRWFALNQERLNAISNINYPERIKRFKDFFDIGNKDIDVITRVYYFLQVIQFPPKNPILFRFNLGPKNVFEMTNHYSITLGLAYEFMHTVNQMSDEYCRFIKSLRVFNRGLTSDIKHHVVFWPYWAIYNYPLLLGTIQVESPSLKRMPTDPKLELTPPVLGGIMTSRRESTKLIPITGMKVPMEMGEMNLSYEYRCQTVGCDQSFRYKFLLYEHNSTGGCGLTDEEKRLLAHPTPTYICPFNGCFKTFGSVDAFKSHCGRRHRQLSPIPSKDSNCSKCPQCHGSEELYLKSRQGYTHPK